MTSTSFLRFLGCLCLSMGIGAGALAQGARPLVFYGDRAFAPWESLDERGQPRGAMVELLKALGRELGRPIELRLTDWQQAQQRVLAGDGDALTQMVPTPERRELYAFSRPMAQYAFALFVRTDGAGSTLDPTRLAGRRIGAVAGGGPLAVLQSLHPGLEPVPVRNQDDGIDRLMRGELDALAAPTWTALHLLRERDIGSVMHLPPFTHRSASIAVRKADTALLAQIDAALLRLEQSGEIARIVSAWSPDRVFLFTGSAVLWAQLAALTALLALIGLVVATWLLQRERRRLGEEIAVRAQVEASVRAVGENTRRLQQFTAELARAVTPDELGSAAARLFGPLLATPCVHVAELANGGREWASLGMSGFDESCREHWWRFPIGDTGPLSAALAAGGPVIAGDLEALKAAHPQWLERCGGDTVKALYVALLHESGGAERKARPIGVLLMAWNEPQRFDDERRADLDAVATLVAQALERTQLRRADQVALEHQAVLHSVGAALAAATRVGDVCWIATSAATRALGAVHGAVVLLESVTDVAAARPEQPEQLVMAFSAQLPPTVAERFARFPLEADNPAARATRFGRSEFISDRPQFERALPGAGEIAALAGVKAVAAMPLPSSGTGAAGFQGALTLHFDHEHAFDADERAFLESIAGLAGRALERCRLLERLRRNLADSQAERRLLDSLIEQSPVGVLVADALSRHLVRASHSAQAIGGPVATAPAQPLDSFDWRGFRPGRREPLRPDEWPLARALSEGRAVGPERLEVERPDGSRRVVDIWGTPIRDAGGQVLAATATFVDVTDRVRAESARRESELRLQLALDGAGMGMWDMDPLTGRSHWGRTIYTLLGLEPGDGDESLDRFLAHLHEDDRPRIEREVAQALAQRRDIDATFRIRRADGEVRWLASHGHLLPGEEGGAPAHMIGINHDVTPMMQVQQELEAAARQKDEFLAMLGHELRNPLAPIANSAVLLARAGHREDIRLKAVAMIERQTRQLITLVDELLEVSRVRHGRVHLQLGRIDLAPLVEAALESVRPQAERQGHQLVFSAPPARLIVLADAQRTTQMLVNLVNNAIKYTPDGGRIEIDCARDPAAPMAQVRVRDNGTGIAPHFLPQVFELFSQSRGTLERSQGGLGLGLSIVRRLAELHGGSVEAHSAGVGHGSTFTLKLPLADPG